MLSDHGRRPRLVVITLSLAMLFSCRERPAGGSVARVGKAIVLVDEVRATMARTGKSAPAALTDLINFELLANRAMRAVRDPMPAVGAGRHPASNSGHYPTDIDELVRERTLPAVQAALRSLLEAPSAGGAGKNTKKGKANA